MADRRSFIKNGGMLTLGMALMKKEFLLAGRPLHLPGIGIQLYMVREDMANDPVGTLRGLGKMGYTQLESYNGDKGIFWGFKNKEFNKMAGDQGLAVISSHYQGDRQGYEKTAAEAAEIGMRYLIYPWKGPQKSLDDFKRIAEEFNGYGEICVKNGLRFAYHPHDYPYKKLDGRLPIDVLLEHTDPGLVDFEMDVYYTVTEGQDPAHYLEKYKPGFRLSHLRDVMKIKLPAGSKEESACDLGQGIIDYPALLSLALTCGMEYFFVEQSRLFQETAMESASYNINYLQKI
jgi:sugar phosphate isomerase/epimerase